MSAQIIRGDALVLPLGDESVDLIVTSPPYFGLRSYTDGGEHYAGQLGAEATPVEFVDALIAATREMVRVLKPSGSIWLNLGDRYSGGDQHGAPAKSLIGVPWRYAIRCVDDLGLLLRAEVIWSKPNGLPESVTDRVRRSHETWFHFAKEPRYYSAVDAIREPHTRMWGPGNGGRGGWDRGDHLNAGLSTSTPHPLGKLPGSVWTVPTQPLTVPAHLGVDHFAAFPMEWPRRIITGWCPREVCSACGQGRRPVAERQAQGRARGDNGGGARWRDGLDRNSVKRAGWKEGVRYGITGYACACPDTSALSTPGVVLDPFGGTGTTALVAHALGRHGISVDLSADYCRLARWRTTDPGQLAAAMQVEKPAAETCGTDDLLTLLDGEVA